MYKKAPGLTKTLANALPLRDCRKAITHAMKPVHLMVHLLLVVAAVGMQAATDEAYLDSMFDDPSHDVGASAGRRGGRVSLTTSGSFMISANRAGNDEDE